MQNIISKNNFILFVLSILLILPLFNTELLIFPASILLVLALLFFLLKKDLALNFMFFTIFAGTLLAVNTGFTFKAAQFFAIFSFLNLFIRYISGERDFFTYKLRTYFPFILYILCTLPSFCTPILYSEDYEPVSNISLLFNYLFLQLICFVTATGINNQIKIERAIKFSFFSYTLVLGFGILQQIGFYTGIYDPYQYLGFHSLFVDFYGPFLRISPGTFANEFGEITQSIMIFITTFLIFMAKEISKRRKYFLYFFLLISFLALIINFTRASWLVYFLYLSIIFFIEKPKFKNISLFIIITLIIGFIVYYINQQTDILSIIPILDRFSELSDLSSNSAGTRLEAWEISYNLFLRSPIIGNGLGIATATHNVPLQLLAETGIIGFLSYYFLMSFLVFKFYKMRFLTNNSFLKSTSISVFFSLVGCILFDFTNHGIYHFILWLIIGIGLATDNLIKKHE